MEMNLTGTDRWFYEHANVTALGRAFVEVGFTAEQLQAYYEKPWKWTPEWNALQHGGQRELEQSLYDSEYAPRQEVLGTVF